MATITISDLSITGSDLFLDSESYMNELTDDSLTTVSGGGWISIATVIATYAGTVALSAYLTRDANRATRRL